MSGTKALSDCTCRQVRPFSPFLPRTSAVWLALAVLLLRNVGLGQDELGMGLEESSEIFTTDTLPADTFAHIAKPKLLPDNISFMERTLWGENGLVRSIGLASPLTAESRKHELAVRRTMLTAHQIGGFVTLGLMGTAAYFGQQVLNGRNDLRGAHNSFVLATIISYSATGALAIFSPPPLIRRDEFSTTTLHKTLAWVHFAGMIVTPILGAMINRHTDYYHRAHVHQVSAYITTATLAVSMIVMTF